MCQSKYVLNPAGDSPWAFRFYEILMCKSVPIVENYHHTYRSAEESNINYNYILTSNIDKINEYDINNIISTNTKLFKKYHMLN